MCPASARQALDGTAPIVGRVAELAELLRLLGTPSVRMVTLTGPPGVGKSRVALEVARHCGARFPDGVRHVRLTAADDQGALAQLAAACGVRDTRGASGHGLAARLAERLRGQAVLLVLDGCERHRALGPTVADVLAAAPRVKVLATSRARFRLPVEHELALPPLPMPGRELAHDPTRLAGNDAVRLFVERARAVRPDFVLGAGNSAAVRALCVRADGLPLVIELLAARLTTFSPQELAVRMQNRRLLLDTGAPAEGSSLGSQHTLRAAIGWSHDQLGPVQRRLLRGVSVFPGAWTLAAAEQVLGDPTIDVAEATESLVAQSLVQPLPSTTATGAGSFRLLDSIREFAAEQLALHGEAEAVRRRHMHHFARLAVAAEAGFGTLDEELAQEWIRAAHTDLQLALDHALENDDSDAALPLAAAMGWFELSHGSVGEARAAVERAVAAARAQPYPPDTDLLCGALLVSGVLAEVLARLTEAQDRLREALGLAEAAGDVRREAVAHAFLGHVARRDRRYAEAATSYARALALHEAGGNEHSRAWAWYDLGLLALEEGDLGRSSGLLADAVSWFRDAGEPWSLAWAQRALGEVRLHEDAVTDGAALLVEAVATFQELDDLRGTGSCLEGLAAVACLRGQGDLAARLLGAAEHAHQQAKSPPVHASAGLAVRTYTALAALMGDDERNRAVRAGARLPLAAAVALATSLAGAAAEGVASPLSPRQREVAVQVAAGRTNRQIARVLGITEKTVEVHLSQAMRRIGARSRSEVAAHAVEAGLRDAPGPAAPAHPG